MPEEKLSILYFDDQERFRKEFCRRQSARFNVTTAADISEIMGALGESRSGLPDLLLLDLYHDLDRSGPARARRVEDAEIALEALDDVLREVKAKVDLAWRPAALDTIKRVRERFSPRDLPIMVYSQRGLFLLDEEQMKAVEEAEAHWMIKDRGEHYEAERIRRVVERRPGRRVARDVSIAGISVIAGAAIAYVLQLLG